MSKKKKGHVPYSVYCLGCKRNIVTTDYQMGGYPDRNTPREKIHEIIDPTSPMFAVYCTCGHHTVSTPEQRV